MHPIKCSLIISTYNWPQALELCLNSVAVQKHLPNEVIIADDGSDDKTKSLIDQLKKDFPVPLIHVWHEDKGFRKTIILNKAVHQSTCEYIIQVDGDVVLDKHFIGDHLSSTEPASINEPRSQFFILMSPSRHIIIITVYFYKISFPE